MKTFFCNIEDFFCDELVNQNKKTFYHPKMKVVD